MDLWVESINWEYLPPLKSHSFIYTYECLNQFLFFSNPTVSCIQKVTRRFNHSVIILSFSDVPQTDSRNLYINGQLPQDDFFRWVCYFVFWPCWFQLNKSSHPLITSTAAPVCKCALQICSFPTTDWSISLIFCLPKLKWGRHFSF